MNAPGMQTQVQAQSLRTVVDSGWADVAAVAMLAGAGAAVAAELWPLVWPLLAVTAVVAVVAEVFDDQARGQQVPAVPPGWRITVRCVGPVAIVRAWCRGLDDVERPAFRAVAPTRRRAERSGVARAHRLAAEPAYDLPPAQVCSLGPQEPSTGVDLGLLPQVYGDQVLQDLRVALWLLPTDVQVRVEHTDPATGERYAVEGRTAGHLDSGVWVGDRWVDVGPGGHLTGLRVLRDDRPGGDDGAVPRLIPEQRTAAEDRPAPSLVGPSLTGSTLTGTAHAAARESGGAA